MTNNTVARNVEGYTNLVVNNVRGCPPADCSYRLWQHGDIIPGNPIIILVHGAVVPLVVPIPGADCHPLHQINSPNNDRCCFYQLDSLLYEECHHNVFIFEYACMAVKDVAGNVLGYVNYGCLQDYGEMLIRAIREAKDKSRKSDGTVGAVNIIAHSMGGLVARYAVQNQRAGTIDNIITLDTGHLGFWLAKIVDDLLVDPLKELLHLPTACSEDAAPGSKFVKDLNDEFSTCPALWSLCATQPVPPNYFCGIIPPPPIEITAVDLSSSSVGTYFHLPYNHMSIANITDRNHLAYLRIRNILCPRLKFQRYRSHYQEI